MIDINQNDDWLIWSRNLHEAHGLYIIIYKKFTIVVDDNVYRINIMVIGN